jgi:hypothetical protein
MGFLAFFAPMFVFKSILKKGFSCNFHYRYIVFPLYDQLVGDLLLLSKEWLYSYKKHTPKKPTNTNLAALFKFLFYYCSLFIPIEKGLQVEIFLKKINPSSARNFSSPFIKSFQLGK